MFVDGIAFVVTVSWDLKFITTHYLPSRTASKLAQSLKETIRIYEQGGFRVQNLLMDGEFEKVKQHLPEIIVKTTAPVNMLAKWNDTRKGARGSCAPSHTNKCLHKW